MSDETSHQKSSGKPDVDIGLETGPGGTVRRWVVVRHATVWHPPTDVYELDDRLIVVVEIAGMRDADFNVILQGQQLVISGSRQRVSTADCAYHQLEIRFGDFRTEVSLPASVQRDEVSASYRDGFLRVELPYARKQKVQIVNVDIEDGDDEEDDD